MRPTSAVLLVALPALAACAAGGPPLVSPPSAQRELYRIEVRPGRFADVEIFSNQRPIDSWVRGDVDAVWAALPAVYQTLGIANAGVLNADSRLFGRQSMRAYRKLGDRGLSRVIDCGSGYAGDAETYDITLTVVTQLQPAGTTTSVRSWVEASGRQQATSSTPVRCRSLGVLERDIGRLLSQSVAPPAGA